MNKYSIYIDKYVNEMKESLKDNESVSKILDAALIGLSGLYSDVLISDIADATLNLELKDILSVVDDTVKAVDALDDNYKSAISEVINLVNQVVYGKLKELQG